ncbi:uncharacterized protein LOC135923506 isoform X2 [Gordionus sp. m RMFG-2023]
MRSGSSLVANALNIFMTNALYLHEPTNFFYDRSNRLLDNSIIRFDSPSSHLNTTTIEWTSPFTLQVFLALQTCNFTNLDELGWINYMVDPKLYIMARSRVYNEYLNCSYRKDDSYKYFHESKNRALLSYDCRIKMRHMSSGNFTEICRRNPVKVLKFVRGRLRDYIIMLNSVYDDHPLKFEKGNRKSYGIIHLVRDPRAIIYSRIKLHWDTIEPLRLMANKLCRAMKFDHAIHEKRSNDKILTLIKYEDFVNRHPSSLLKLGSFLGIKKDVLLEGFENNRYFYSNKDTEKYLKEESFNTYRRAPKSHVNQWVRGLSLTQKLAINKECREVLRLYKYH